jgi:uncharacterized protein
MSDLHQHEYINRLLAKYHKLLTTTQRKIMEMYYVYNYSLSEIADNLKITRTAVLDALNVSRDKLKHFEEKLNLVEKAEQIDKVIDKIEKRSAKEVAQLLERLRKILNDGI